MIVRRVELINFLSHRNTVVEFDTGIVAIVGPNGAGKSSIIDAIAFTLFGFHSRGSRRNKTLIRLGSSYAVTRVEFEIGGRRYVAERRLEANGRTSAALYEIDGRMRRLIARDVRTVEAEIEKLLGVKKEVARVALIAQQGELAEILESSRRKEYVHRLLGLDVIEKTYEKLRGIISNWQMKQTLLAREIEEKKRKIEELKVRVKEAEEAKIKLVELKKVLEAERVKLAEAHSRLRELERLRAEKQQLEVFLRQLEEKKARLQNEVAELQERVEKLKTEIEALRSHIEANPVSKLLANVPDDKIPEALELLSDAVSLMDKVRQLMPLYKNLEEQLEEAEREAVEAEKANELRRKLRELEDKVREYNELKTRYTLLRNQLEKLTREYEVRRTEYEHYLERLKRAASRFLRGLEKLEPANIDTIVTRLENLLEEVKGREKALRERLEKLQAEKLHLQKKIDEIGDNIEKLASAQGRCPLCGRPLRDFERRKLILQLRSQREELEAKLTKLEAEAEQLSKVLENVTRMKDDLEKTLRGIQSVVGTLSSIAAQLENLKSNINSLKAEVREVHMKLLSLKGVEEEYEELRKTIEDLPSPEAVRKRIEYLQEQKRRIEDELIEIHDELARVAKELGLKDVALLSELKQGVIEEFKSSVNMLATLHSDLEATLANLEEKKAELESLEAQIERFRARLRELENVDNEIETTEKQAAELQSRVTALEHEVAKLSMRIEEGEKAAKHIEKLEDELRKLREEYERIRRLVSDLMRLRRALSKEGLPRLIRILAKNIIEQYLREILAQFNIEFMDVKVTDDYEVILVSPGGFEKEFRMLSGGEKTAIALAFRIAFARMLAGRGRINTLILDEPTMFLDEHRKRELINILRYGWRGSGAILPQLIVVTHDREIEEAADLVIEVEKRDGVSTVRVVPVLATS